MKKIGILLMFAIFSITYIAAQENSNGTPNMEFKTTVHDFGKIAEEIGQATCSFEFTNTGNAPLIINSVRTSCGCTTPSYTKEPVLPGKTGTIKVAYTTTNRVGAFSKGVTVFTNIPDATFRLTIKGEVLPRK